MGAIRQKKRIQYILAVTLICSLSPLQINQLQAAPAAITLGSFDYANKSHLRPSATINSILRDVIRQMEPALTNFMTTYSFNRITSTTSSLERKYQSNSLSISWDISSDAKLFVVIKVNGKQFCYTNIGAYSIKLVKSKRCK